MLAEGFDERPETDKERIQQVVGAADAANAKARRKCALRELQRVIGSARRLPYHKASTRERGAPPPLSWSWWRSAVAVARSAQGPTLVRCGEDFRKRQHKRLERQARRKRMSWQISYNLACYEATLAGKDLSEAPKHRKNALEHLRRSLERPNASQLRRSWLLADPDLKPLQMPATQDEFERISRAVRP
jgi:hypothetical protein